jgi:hypothetical protein
MSATTKDKDDEVAKASRKLSEALSSRYQTIKGIKHEGKEVILPYGKSLRWAKLTIEKAIQAEEEEMSTNVTFDAHPDDALVALHTVIGRRFGELMGVMTMGWFGPNPAEQRTVQISVDKTVVLPIGASEIFGGDFPLRITIRPVEDKSSDVGGRLEVQFNHLRAWEPFVKEIEDEVRAYLVDNSIFKGQAINSDYTFLDLRFFDPERRVVYSNLEREKLGGEVFAPIVATRQWVANGGSLKRGVLLYGDYGTGKSLTLMYIAKLAERNGWTFINVKPGDSIKRVLRFAKRYAPAIVAVEDIDREAGVKRTDAVNDIINGFDSVISKDDKVIIVMTTNSRENIQPAMLRPGRIDTSIEMGKLDPQAVRRLVENQLLDENGESILDGELDEKGLFEAAQGYTNAFVVEGVRRALGYSLMRKYESLEGNMTGDDGHVRVTSEDIEGGLRGLRDQWNLMRTERAVAAPMIDGQIRNIVNEAVGPLTEDINLLVGKVGLKKNA